MSSESGYVPEWVYDDLFDRKRRRLLNRLETRQAFKYAMRHFGEDTARVESRFLVWQTFLHLPHVVEFVDKIPQIINADEAAESYAAHLLVEPCFETIARDIRRLKAENGLPATPSPLGCGWYGSYLKTSHWSGRKQVVRNHYKSCVLCGQDEGKLNTHHKHYRTLGSEGLFDLSLLCDPCHDSSHQFLGLRVPRVMPPAVGRIFKAEGVKWTDASTGGRLK